MADDTKAPETGRDYKDTLFLPSTEFPMRAGLPKAEPQWIAKWDGMGLYQKMREDARARGAEPFILHDGPPYANGAIHLGTAMNKILKDIVVRSHQMTGFDASYIPGWDCHGLPIEWKVEEEFRSKGRTKDDVPGDEFRRACRDYAAKWIEVQKAGFRRCGVEGDWDNPYLTMNFASEAATVREFLRVAMSGRLVRGAKPVMWSPVERTALAEAEVEYHDRKVPTIWVKFPVVAVRGRNGNVGTTTFAWRNQGDLYGASVVIWTTTPWTIPANQAIAYSKDIEYSLYEVTEVASEEELGFKPYAQVGEKLVIADALANSVFDAAKVTGKNKLRSVDPWEIAYCKHPLSNQGWALSDATSTQSDYFFDRLTPLVCGDHVTDDAGTGFVHTAPAHGEDDFFVFLNTSFGRENDEVTEQAGQVPSAVLQIVDADGCYTSDLPEPLRGLDIIRTSGKKRGEQGKANPEVIRLLAEAGNLFARGMSTIRDAHSWRSKAPVIRRATPQWFISMDIEAKDGGKPLRALALSALEDSAFVPASGRNRITTMVADRPDWLISRQRNWGVPITLLVSPDGKPHPDALPEESAKKVNKRIFEKIVEVGVEGWFSTPVKEFLADFTADLKFVTDCSGMEVDPAGWEKVTDVLDVWFDSGTTHAFTLRDRGIIDEATGQADVYLEGSDQHRGWFQSSLLECCATRGMAPYKTVVTHGFIVDAEGKKMSKSLGNTVEPQKVADQFGIEILRLWTASSDFTEDLRISDDILKTNADSYRRIRNTLRYLLGALEGYTEEEAAAPAEMPELERWVLHRLAQMDALVRKSFETFDYKRVMSAMLNFTGVDLSAVYFDIRKDSLYCDAPDDNRRRAARTVMALVLERLVAWLAPIMPFTTEEAFLMSPFAGRAASIHLTQLPETPAAWQDEALAARWEKIFTVRRVVTGALEVERREKRIGASLEAAPVVHIADAGLLELAGSVDMAELSITSAVTLTGDPAPAEAFTLPEVDGVAVMPALAEGGKCARCWKILPEVTAGQPVCNRCDAAVTAIDGKA